MTIDLHCLDSSAECDLGPDKGKNDIPDEMVTEGHVFMAEEGANTSMTFGPVSNEEGKPMNIVEISLMDDMKCNRSCHDLSRVSGKKGFECMRKGGSCGRPRADKELMAFLSKEGMFPQPSEHILLTPLETKWECLHMSALKSAKKNDQTGLTRSQTWNKNHPACRVSKENPFMPCSVDCRPPV